MKSKEKMKSKPRKQELQEELSRIQEAEIRKKLDEMQSVESGIQAKLQLEKEEMHHNVIKVDLFIKTVIALAISIAFFYTVVQGVHHGTSGTKASVHFQMISVLGPLFGAVLQYFYGKSKAGANGE